MAIWDRYSFLRLQYCRYRDIFFSCLSNVIAISLLTVRPNAMLCITKNKKHTVTYFQCHSMFFFSFDSAVVSKLKLDLNFQFSGLGRRIQSQFNKSEYDHGHQGSLR